MGAERFTPHSQEVRIVRPDPVRVGGPERLPPVIGERLGILGVDPFACEGGVGAHPLYRQEARVGDVEQQTVVEPISGGGDVEEVQIGEPGQCSADVRDVALGQERDVSGREALARDGREGQEDPFAGGELVEAGPQRALQGERQIAPLRQRPRELDHEQGIALGPLNYAVIPTTGESGELASRVGLESFELDEEAVATRSNPRGIGELGPRGGDHEQARPPEGEPVDKPHHPGVGPMDVVDGEHDEAVRAEQREVPAPGVDDLVLALPGR